VRPLLPVLVAGATFAVAAVVGLTFGVVAAERFDRPLWSPVGLVVGAGVGAYSALRLLLRSLR
jgi:hypothetical protein